MELLTRDATVNRYLKAGVVGFMERLRPNRCGMSRHSALDNHQILEGRCADVQ